jgi:uncharacterized protein YndB with AHSA1/START domain
MPVARASRDLHATPEDVWTFLAEPYHLADWWPGLGAVEPDRHGVAVGARWRIRRREATLFRKADAEDTLVVTAADPAMRFAFELVRAKIRAELTLASAAGRGTNWSSKAHSFSPSREAFRRPRSHVSTTSVRSLRRSDQVACYGEVPWPSLCSSRAA